MKAAAATFLNGLTPMKNRDFRWYFGGQGISMLGTWIQVTAQSWVVWKLSGKMSELGVVAMLSTLPLLFLGPYAGGVVDRVDRRRLLILLQVVAMLLAVVLAVLTQFDLVKLWHVYIVSALLGVVTAFDFPAQQVFVGDVVGIQEIRKATALNSTLVQLGRMLGPGTAGLLIAKLGIPEAFWLNALSFLAVIVSLMVICPSCQKRETNAENKKEFGEAIRFILANPRVLDLIGFAVLVSFFIMSTTNIFPAFATRVLQGDAGTYGLIVSASGAGAFCGSILVIGLAQVRRSGLLMICFLFVAGALFGATSFVATLPSTMALVFFGSMAVPAIFVTCNGLLQVLSPTELRGRVMSAYIMASFGTQPVAALVVGAIGDAFGPAVALRFNGTMLLVGGILMMLRPGLLKWEVDHKAQSKMSMSEPPADDSLSPQPAARG